MTAARILPFILGAALTLGCSIPASAQERRAVGDQALTYPLPDTGAPSPYRIYIPTRWKPGAKLPMVVMLHGGGLDQNAPFDREPPELKGQLFRLAEQYGFILVAPNGYDKSGGYGYVMTRPPTPPQGVAPSPGVPATPPQTRSPEETARVAALSETDTLAVVDRVAGQYGVDRKRIFLMGNSMGGVGTMYLATHRPNLWRAIAPSEGGIDPARFGDVIDQLRVRGVLMVKKDDAVETTARATQTRDAIRAHGIPADLIVVPNSRHETAWYIALPQIFAFFASHLK